MNRKRMVTVPLICAAILLSVYLAFNMYNRYFASYRTEVALYTTISDNINTTGVVLRSEKVSSDVGTSLYYNVSDGEKVAMGSVIAEKYSSVEAATNAQYISKLKKELETVENLSSKGVGSVNLESVKRSIYSLIQEFSGSTSQHDYSNLSEFKNELLSLISSYEMASGGEIDTTEYKELLESKIAEAETNEYSPSGTINSEYSGYYISFSDNCENLIAFDELDTLTVDDAQELIELCSKNYSINTRKYRIVDDYDWYYVTVLSAEEASRLKVDYKYSVSFAYTSVGAVTGKINSITYSSDNSKAVVVVGFDRVNDELIVLRNTDAEIGFSNYKGIKVERSALRFNDGDLGVYIKYGDVVKFRTLNIIYETDDYVLSSVTEGSSTRLSLYDEIIISGKNLYVNKRLA